MPRVEIVIGGYGGQGVVLMGQILGKAAAFDGKNAVQLGSYGAEVRGTFTKSEVIISDDRISYPAVRKCDVAMSQEALDRLLPYLKDDGVLIVDSNVERIPNVRAKTYVVPATKTAREVFGKDLMANMIILGALVKITRIVSEESVEKGIEESVPKGMLGDNIKAFKIGLGLV
jgi:2-oxoglutarate ferredoxin oxidoreductase subunit gamma